MESFSISIPINSYENGWVNELDRTQISITMEELQQILDAVVVAVETKNIDDLELLTKELNLVQ
jgi:hypothetical protein